MEDKNSILFELKTIFGEENSKQSAMIVDKEMFHSVYRAMVRIAATNGWHLYLVELILKNKNNQKSANNADRFIELTSPLLRCCDVVFKYSESQVMVLLMVKEKNDYSIPIDRIIEVWDKDGVPNVEITHKQEEVIIK